MDAGAVDGVLVFGVIEAGQLFLPQRVPDVTDVLWGTIGTAAGLRIAGLVGADGVDRKQ